MFKLWLTRRFEKTTILGKSCKEYKEIVLTCKKHLGLVTSSLKGRIYRHATTRRYQYYESTNKVAI